MARQKIDRSLFQALVFTALCLQVRAQNCDTTGITTLVVADVSTISSDSTATLVGAATAQALSGIELTTAVSGSFGGLFLNNPTAFQGPGGFSIKFSIQNTGTANHGGAWEFIIAESSNRAFSSPPFASPAASNGLSGWSRKNSFVVEFDIRDSGTPEQDTSSDHISVFLAGAEQMVCKHGLPAGTSFGSGTQYTIWIDYSGFNTNLEIRYGTDSSTRPTAAATSCSVNVWGTLDISNSHYIGFGAYNDASGDADATVLSLTESLSAVDARRPIDGATCAIFDKCSRKSVNGLCSPLNDASASTCTLVACGTACQWDLSGSRCCAFVERGGWQATDSTAANQAGDVVSCSLIRNTILQEVDDNLCSGAAVSPSPSPSMSTNASPLPSPTPAASATSAAISPSSSPLASPSTSLSPSQSASGSPQPSASPSAPLVASPSSSTVPSPSASPNPSNTASPTPSVTPSASFSPSPTPATDCDSVCKDVVKTLTCSSDTAAIAAAQATTCLDSTTGNPSTCECGGFGDDSLSGGGDFDPSNNDDFSNCVANTATAVASAHTGAYTNVFIKQLTSGNGNFYIEKAITDSTICAITSQSNAIVFNADLSYSNVIFGELITRFLDIQARTTFSDISINFINVLTTMEFAQDASNVGGLVTWKNVDIGTVFFSQCTIGSGVTISTDSESSVNQVIMFFGGSNTCPALLGGSG